MIQFDDSKLPKRDVVLYMNIYSTNLKNYHSPAKIFFFSVIILDVLLIILAIQGYYFISLKPTGALLPILLTLVAFYVYASRINVEKFWILLVVLLVLPILGFIWVNDSLLDKSYETIESPSGKEVLIIEHRDATLGETNHFYQFYRKTAFPGLMYKLNKETVRILTRGTSANNLEVLGVKKAVWTDASVTFSSSYAKTEVVLRRKRPLKNKARFTPLETDIVQLGENVKNIKRVDEFIEDSESGIDSEIRYVILENEGDPIAVYTLKSRTDSYAGQSWVEISRDWNFDSEKYDVIEPQQCSSISKDTERGAYYLTECFHKWEIELMPVQIDH